MITLVMMANHQDGKWWDEWKKEWIEVKRGQLITSLDKLVKSCGKGISVQNIRTALLVLEKMQFLTNQSTKHYRLITLVNYDLYQTPENYLTKQPTKAQQRLNKGSTINNNGKHGKNDKEKDNIYTPEFEQFWSAYPRHVEKKKSFAAWKARLNEKEPPTTDQLIIAATNYFNQCKVKGTETTYIKYPATFLGPNKPYEDLLKPQQSLFDSSEPASYQAIRDFASRGDDDGQTGDGEIIDVCGYTVSERENDRADD